MNKSSRCGAKNIFTLIISRVFTLLIKGDMFCHTGLGHYGHHPDPGEVDLPPETQPTPPSATLVGTTITHLRDSDHQSAGIFLFLEIHYIPYLSSVRFFDIYYIIEGKKRAVSTSLVREGIKIIGLIGLNCL